MGKMKVSVIDRLLSKVEVNDQGCWIWIGGKNKNGYGFMSVSGRTEGVHRIAYRVYREEIPEGMTIDHLCCNRACCNPEHLEVVTLADNQTRRAQRQWIKHLKECQGEDYLPEWTPEWYWWDKRSPPHP